MDSAPKEHTMPTQYKVIKPFDSSYRDIIHVDNQQLFEDQYEESYVIENFIDQHDCDILKQYFDKVFETNGQVINNHIRRLIHPSSYSFIMDCVEDLIRDHFNEDVVFYSDVENQPWSVGDQMFITNNPFGLHTDSVTHIPGYRPYKDIVIPIWMENSNTYVTFNQRYRGRATHFMRGRHINNFSPYSNTFRMKPYEEYGVEGVDYRGCELDSMPARVPVSVYQGLTVEHVFDWIPGNAIVQDTSVLHAPSSTDGWKVGLTFHLMIKDENWNGEQFSVISKEPYYTIES